jgi:hypothetical protein
VSSDQDETFEDDEEVDIRAALKAVREQKLLFLSSSFTNLVEFRTLIVTTRPVLRKALQKKNTILEMQFQGISISFFSFLHFGRFTFLAK